MKAFFEEYGLSTIMACVIMFLLVMASPVGGAIKGGLTDSTDSLKNTGSEVQAKAGNSIKNLASEEEAPDTIYVGYNSPESTLVFSHDENSPKYSECDIKYGEINQANKPEGQASNGKSGSSLKSGRGVITVDIDIDDELPTLVPWHDTIGSAIDIRIENKIKPYSMQRWFEWLSWNASTRRKAQKEGREFHIYNLNNIDTSQCTDMSGLFKCTSRYKINSQDLAGWDTSNVTNMSNMFCDAFKDGDVPGQSLNLSNFNTSKVTSMNHMFYDCMYLTSLNISSFDTSKVTDMTGMFSACSRLENISYGSKFTKKEGCDTSGMYQNCPANKPSWWTD